MCMHEHFIIARSIFACIFGDPGDLGDLGDLGDSGDPGDPGDPGDLGDLGDLAVQLFTHARALSHLMHVASTKFHACSLGSHFEV